MLYKITFLLVKVKWWWHTPLIPAFGKQKQVDLREFETSLFYKASSRIARTITQRNPVSINYIK